MDVIDRMSKDMMFIEDLHTNNMNLWTFKEIGCRKGLGAETQDVRFPVLVSREFIENKLKMLLRSVEVEIIIASPNSSLKTRKYLKTTRTV